MESSNLASFIYLFDTGTRLNLGKCCTIHRFIHPSVHLSDQPNEETKKGTNKRTNEERNKSTNERKHIFVRYLRPIESWQALYQPSFCPSVRRRTMNDDGGDDDIDDDNNDADDKCFTIHVFIEVCNSDLTCIHKCKTKNDKPPHPYIVIA